MTPEEAADVLSIGRSKLYELLGEGVLESVAIGACRRVPSAALEQFVERLRSGQLPEKRSAEVSALRGKRASA